MSSTAMQLHKSKFHREGFDPNCPKCISDEGLGGIIRHLESCAKQNEVDAHEVAGEQRRMIGVLKILQRASNRLR